MPATARLAQVGSVLVYYSSPVTPISRTFDYEAVVPSDATDGLFECQARCRAAVPAVGQAWDARIVGLEPLLSVTDPGQSTEPLPGQPLYPRVRLTLSTTSREPATVREAYFHVHRALTRHWLPGDILYLRKTGCEGLALSVVRRGELVVALGAVTEVPLGDNVSAKLNEEVLAEALPAFARVDPGFEFPSVPIEVTVAGTPAILFEGWREVNGYQIKVEHCFRRAIPGIECRAAIWTGGIKRFKATVSSLEMMWSEGIRMTPWLNRFLAAHASRDPDRKGAAKPERD